MPMSYTSLTAPKGTSGAIATWVNYTLLDVPVIVEEAQALLYASLRTREMIAEYVFSVPSGNAYVALPQRFLDPIGRIKVLGLNLEIRHKEGEFVKGIRSYTEQSGALPDNPFTTSSGSSIVTVNIPNHGLTQDSVITISGASAVNGLTPNGSFPVSAIIDANTISIDATSLGVSANASGSGGGSGVTYVADALTVGTATWYGIWQERINFDVAFSQQAQCRMLYYQSLPLLSSSNQTNFLTSRYPHLMRTACMAAAADFMKDDTEYQKLTTRLAALIQQVNVDNDGYLRGAEIDTETP